ncbi:hypothetical protein ABIF65_008562 [Bradyrhizobium japonicum]|nr:hypothetical protein [Bradyrhizobium japonicum]MCP1864371.1 hypothetical protein [Bradyrhizobium japonicum]MCP1894958.1 hypothetical protein [Bradyrhizobium japonicum]MCW2328342.1 hypothetical protein [Bradyrhizobium japonicum]
MASKRSASGVAKTVRDVDLSPPRAIRDHDFLALSGSYGLTSTKQAQVEVFLKMLIDEFRIEVAKIRKQRTRADDRKNLKRAIECLSNAKFHLDACGRIGRTITRDSISDLGQMLTAGWISRASPKFGLPKQSYNIASRGRELPRAERVYIEEHTLQHRRLFARSENISLVSAVLREIQSSLDEALRRGTNRGGRREAVFRYYFMLNLAEVWKQIGRDPRTAGAFQFPQFCEDVLVYIGWPTSGLRAIIRKAVAHSMSRP